MVKIDTLFQHIYISIEQHCLEPSAQLQLILILSDLGERVKIDTLFQRIYISIEWTVIGYLLGKNVRSRAWASGFYICYEIYMYVHVASFPGLPRFFFVFGFRSV